jgi:acetyl esterase/lipase
MFNSAHELVPASQPADMGKALRAAGVPEQVVIVPGSQHGASYVSQESPTLIKFLGRYLTPSRVRLVATGKSAPSSGTPLWLIILCAVVAAGSLAAALLATRRRTAGYR